MNLRFELNFQWIAISWNGPTMFNLKKKERIDGTVIVFSPVDEKYTGGSQRTDVEATKIETVWTCWISSSENSTSSHPFSRSVPLFCCFGLFIPPTVVTLPLGSSKTNPGYHHAVFRTQSYGLRAISRITITKPTVLLAIFLPRLEMFLVEKGVLRPHDHSKIKLQAFLFSSPQLQPKAMRSSCLQ